MRRLLPLLLLVVACTSRPGVSLLDDPAGVTPYKGAELQRNADGWTVTYAADPAGVCIEGAWDLRPYAKLRMTVRNPNPEDHLNLYLYLENEEVNRKPPYGGFVEDRLHVKPGGTAVLEVDLPCDVPHPEVGRLLTLMRSSPYGEFKHIHSGADLSDIRRIIISSRKLHYGSTWDLLSLELVPGKRPRTPDYMQLDSAHFFPMIDRYGQFKYRDWPGKTHSDSDLRMARIAEEKDLKAHPGPSGLDRFGGWADGSRYEATGHFRVKKIKGKWWMIDPEGCLFWSHGIVRVNPSSAVTPLHGENLASRDYMFEYLPEPEDPLYQFRFTNDELLKPYYERWKEDATFDFSSANLYRKYGAGYKKVWAALAHQRLRSWGMNTIANSSDIDICRMDRTPFIDRFDIRSVPIEGADGPWFPIMDPFDPSFKAAVEAELEAHKRDIEDPWLLGYFVDNEIKWGDATHAAKCVAAAPETQAARKAMRTFLTKKYGKKKIIGPENATEEDLLEFNRLIIREYYKVIRDCFDRLAPGVLYMGCRFASFNVSNPDVITIGAEYCDVISHNQYRYTIESYSLPEGIDKPVIIGEWHLGALDRGMFNPSLQQCRDQQERAHYYKEYVRSALENPCIIGVHWHQYMDQATTGRFDGENFQVGFLDCCDTPYPETVAASREVGYKLYQLRSTARR